MAWRGTCLALFLMLCTRRRRRADDARTRGRHGARLVWRGAAGRDGHADERPRPNQIQTTVSGATGAFLFPQVPVGTYKVEIALQGFKTATFTKVSVAVGQEYSLTAQLELGAI